MSIISLMSIDGDGNFGLVDWHKGLMSIDWGSLVNVDRLRNCNGFVSIDWGWGYNSLLYIDWGRMDWVAVSMGISVLSVVLFVVSVVSVVGLEMTGVSVAVATVLAVGSVSFVGLIVVVSGVLEIVLSMFCNLNEFLLVDK